MYRSVLDLVFVAQLYESLGRAFALPLVVASTDDIHVVVYIQEKYVLRVQLLEALLSAF